MFENLFREGEKQEKSRKQQLKKEIKKLTKNGHFSAYPQKSKNKKLLNV